MRNWSSDVTRVKPFPQTIKMHHDFNRCCCIILSVKLNIGCGSKPKAGYVNIDLFDQNADRKMDACNLDFDDNTAESIEMEQVIEHLGFIHGSLALSEAYRVLKDGGLLVVETPEIDSAFKQYLQSSNREKKAELLNWIYGLEFPGYQHKFCFPKELMLEMLGGIGFEILEISDVLYDGFPAYRVRATKRHSGIKQKLSYERKNALAGIRMNGIEDYALAVDEEKRRWEIK